MHQFELQGDNHLFIRAFFKAETKTEAETHLKQLLVLAETIHLKLEVLIIEPY